MKAIGIVTDSHCGISQEEAAKLGIKVIPMPFTFEDKCYYEGVSITRQEFFERLNEGETFSTSQPSPEEVMNTWDESLQEYEKILHMPMSSGLSGACNTAIMLSQQDEYEGKVFVVDNGRVSSPMHRAIIDALELIEEGYSAEKIKEILEEARDKMAIYIAVETLELLKKGGRISATAATVGTVLNIKPILKLGVGVLDSYKKCRGMKKAKIEMLAAMKEELNTTFREAYEKGEIYMIAASSADEDTTNAWVEEIKEHFPGMDVMCDDLSLGICCHTGAGALGIGCSCKPKR